MAQPATATAPQEEITDESGLWFDQALCGVFFHWGPYSVAGRGEWVMNRERIPAEEYERLYIDTWEADRFDAEIWMQTAKSFGADYVVLTTRHHDGFALWDSEANPHNAKNKGPKRDIVAEFTDAAHRHGLRVGLYYSLANWVHPDYPQDFYRDWPGDLDWASEAAHERFREYNRRELEELLSQYGQIDYLWYDGHYPENVRNDALNTMARELQPGILINERNGPTGDVRISEQGIREPRADTRWEACFTLNRNWGYHHLDSAYKRPDQLLELLMKVREQGGNLLLNIGPCGRGCIPEPTRELLQASGEWIRAHRALLAEAEPNGFSWNNSALVTTAGDCVYLHFLELPETEFCWAETDQPLLEATYLPERIPIAFKQDGLRIRLKGFSTLPRQHVFNTVELRFESKPEPTTPLTTYWIPS